MNYEPLIIIGIVFAASFSLSILLGLFPFDIPEVKVAEEKDKKTEAPVRSKSAKKKSVKSPKKKKKKKS